LSFCATAAMTENEFRDYDGMSVDENEEERPTEIGQILDDLVEGFEDSSCHSTLLRLSEEGVALDMDEVVVEVEDQLSDLDYESEDSESGGMAGN
jgi:broad specificity phosphatase PhoE